MSISEEQLKQMLAGGGARINPDCGFKYSDTKKQGKDAQRAGKRDRSHKYNAQKIVVDGITFDSIKEGRRYSQLKLLERADEIRNLKLQVKIPLFSGGKPLLGKNGRQRHYVADFEYEEREVHTNNWQYVIEDTKGYDTPMSRFKRQMVEAYTGLDIRLT